MAAYASDQKEAPLDPAAERLRRKLVRLLFVSGAIMMLGLIAVFSAIVYKVNGAGRSGTPQGFESATLRTAPISIPRGARVVSTALDGERALLHVEGTDGAASLLLIDLASGRAIGTYRLAPD